MYHLKGPAIVPLVTGVLAWGIVTPVSASMLADIGNDQDETLVGTPNRDRLYGRGGSDEIFGLAAADDLRGGGGSDFVKGGRGADGLSGGPGADRLVGHRDRDMALDGPGPDHIRTGADRDTVTLVDGEDVVHTGAGNDHVGVFPDGHPDLIYCGAGNLDAVEWYDIHEAFDHAYGCEQRAVSPIQGDRPRHD